MFTVGSPRAGLLFLWCASCVLLCTHPAVAGVHFEQPVVNLGEVRSGVLLVQNFRFTNEGPKTVAILRTRPGCGCVAPRLEKKVFAPGESGTIPVEVNTLGQAAGSHRWHVHVHYDQGAGEEQQILELLARVVTEVTVQPAALRLHVGGALEQEMRLMDLRPRPLTVKGVRCSSAHLRVTWGQTEKDSLGQWATPMKLEVLESFPEGTHEEFVTVTTDDPVYNPLKIPVTVVRRQTGRASVTPAQVRLTVSPGQPVPSQILLVRDGADGKVVIEGVEADSPAVSCRWAAGPGNLATVRVRVDRSQVPGGRLRSEVRIRLSAPRRETLAVPVECLPAE